MRIYVARHGEAGEYSPDPQKERERPLTAKGRSDVAAVAAALEAEGEEPTVIYASPYARTMQTADILGRALGARVSEEDDLQPDRDVVPFLKGLLDDDRVHRVMLVGHVDNLVPMLEQLGGGKVDKLRKGEVRRVRFDRKSGEWKERARFVPEDAET